MHGSTTKWSQSAVMYLLAISVAVLSIAVLGIVLQTLGVFEFEVISKLSELSKEREVLTLLGIGIGGLVLILQALIANKRAKAMEETARAQADAARAQATANRNTETGQRQERLKNAIEHLGNESESVRLGGAYELFHLAQDTESLRHTVLNILCSHIRRTTKEDAYQEKHPWQPSEEIQSLLTLLFVHGHHVFTDLHINLYEELAEWRRSSRSTVIGGGRSPTRQFEQGAPRRCTPGKSEICGDAPERGATREGLPARGLPLHGAHARGVS